MDQIKKGIQLLTEEQTHEVYSKVLIGIILFLYLGQIVAYLAFEIYYKKPLKVYAKETKELLDKPKTKIHKFQRAIIAIINEFEYLTLPMIFIILIIIVTYSLSIEALGFYSLIFLSLFVDVVGVMFGNSALKFIGRIGTGISIILGTLLGISSYRIAFSDIA